MIQQFHSGLHPKELKAGTEREISICMFKVALFIIAKSWKQPKYPSEDEWINKM